MNIQIGGYKTACRAYGIDEIALVPGNRTLDPSLTDTSWRIGGITREIPIIASAMDGVVDVPMAVLLSDLGAFGVLNLEGIQTRYPDPNPILEHITSVDKTEFVQLMQKLYAEPIKPDLIEQRIREIKQQGGIAAVSATPVGAIKYGSIVAKAGADLFFVQATVVSTAHLSPESVMPLNVAEFCEEMPIPVVMGNCVTYEVALNLMKTGAAGILVGIGPGAACTSRGVLGVGLPQATAVAECAAARDDYYEDTGKYIPIIADGGLITGGDICKCIACGADAVMIGSPFARSTQAPGRGFHWGMATPNPVLPRGTRIHVGTTGTCEQILRGPAQLDDGTHNLLGALKTSMGTLGAKNIKDMQQVEVVIAPSLLNEGKLYQKAQQIGMGKRPC
ncbi:inosine-5-monophosphate dehydrogenase [Nostoc linckia z18]|uniref:Inosine-5-monophosphate dehydrogenase n=2 Tax=Nostoc linckia TaxID=92942 RepID=A0A9Q5ZFX1_NOSLI|nr:MULTISPECIES: GuaB3 family IMP dehydrogenase-related protein [Nostoc]PHK40667.1 inosine-5-monophosphate dehydrogenase [Nostoc linckia z15]PHK43673.1 inosine-5-monophosphate dehydrogenase [Nostoc linckia z16]MBC1236757.1 GuaB3 family IMP dehydrogenase-related protein [Nostoc sp. 2RC]PHJ63712.1 inosine-5-monophosphate dehydrogenase [Nostoc linckia z1]PHJ69318.1 inosine-5-monophosphate dehydrogenase [Nostoc linckia z3]